MKFGIFYELQLPRPWGVDDERQLYQNALTQVELADRLGYDYAWEVEHHFLEEYSHSPAPEVFLGAASQRTKNIRLGHGIIQLTTNPPQRVAERIACLDLVSNGRVEFGTGESGIDHRTRRLRPRDGNQARGLGRRHPLHHPDVPGQGRRARHQMAQDAAAQRSAEAGAEAASAAVGRLLAARNDRDGGPPRHRRAGLPVPVAPTRRMPGCTPTTTRSPSGRRSCADYQTNPNIALVSYFMCAETDEEARRRADGATFFQFALRLLRFQLGTQAARSLHGQHVGRIQQVEGAPTPRRRRARCPAA